MEFDTQQLEAIERCVDMQRRITPITGEAGTGKTTIIREVYKRLTAAGYDVAVCAPTGKAAKRITEATGIQAVTAHRLLEYPYPGERDPKTGQPLTSSDPKRRNSFPLDQRVVLGDEYMMVKHELHRNLLNALPRGGCICMFGDTHQLAPIEENKRVAEMQPPFEEMLEKFDGFTLTTQHRQKEGSGRIPAPSDVCTRKITRQPVQEITDFCVEHLCSDDDAAPNFNSIDHQIIVPGRKTWVGTFKLNKTLQSIYHPESIRDGFVLPRHQWDQENQVSISVGDKVIWTENSYDLRSYPDRFDGYDSKTNEYYDWFPPSPRDYILNGESGVITSIEPEGGFTIDVGDREVFIPASYLEYSQRARRIVPVDPRTRLDLAYAITTHKAQGSEYRSVIYVLNKSAGYNMSRRNFYTAMSRAKEATHLITDAESLQLSIRRVKR
jgi:exodeoxyribonuclease V alpha subunit